MTVLLAVDLGTESVRACLVSTDGRVIHSARRTFALRTPKPGWAEQDPADWWAETASAVREVIERSGAVGDVAAVGVCGQMHGPVPIAADGSVLPGGVQLWCDKRGADLVASLTSRPDVDTLIRLAGNPPTPAWMGIKIAWERRFRPDRYARTWKFLPPKDFLNFRFTGQAATDLSEASGSFLMDSARERWSDDLTAALGLDLRLMPEIRGAGDVIGTVTGEAARRTGLRVGTPVVAGGGDMLCLLLGAATTRPGRACDTTGTASVLSVFTQVPVSDPRVMNLHHVVSGWIAFGICDSGGGMLHWFKDLVGEAYDVLDRAADDIAPGADGLLVFPYLQGERTLGSPHARGVFFGLTPAHGRGTVARAVMEGVTFELRRALEVIGAGGLTVNEMRTIGGGARSSVWSAIKADVYRLPVRTFAEFEGGVLGAAILAGVGVGVFPNAMEAADRLAVVQAAVEPDPERARQYDEVYRRFVQIHDLLEPGFEMHAEPDQQPRVPIMLAKEN